MIVSDLMRLWLEDRESEVTEARHRGYRYFADDFVQGHGETLAASVTPGAVRAWVRSRPSWRSTSTRRSAIKVVLQAFNFALDEGLLDRSPLTKLRKDLRRMPEARRDYLMTAEDESRLFAEAGPGLSAIVRGLLETGRRPKELREVRKDEAVELPNGRMQWRMKSHKNVRRTWQPETVYLSQAMANLTRWLLADPFNRTPFLFTTDIKRPWTGENLDRAFNRAVARANLASAIVPYSCRHAFITRKLLAGVPIGVIAVMVGTSVVTLARHYAHLEQAGQDVFNAAAEAG